MNWQEYDEANPPKDGKYLVWCVAGQWDSEWFDIARMDGGKWHDFKYKISHHNRVTHYAEVDKPRDNG